MVSHLPGNTYRLISRFVFVVVASSSQSLGDAFGVIDIAVTMRLIAINTLM